MAEEIEDPGCAVCGNPIERGEPRYNRVVEGRLTSVHVECHNKAKPPPV